MSGQALDPTFRNYTPSQASTYAKERGAYPPALYSLIMDYHTSNQCPCNLVLDVGCGPGNATRQIAAYFDSAIGVDPGLHMILTARSLSGTTKVGESVRYEVRVAEEISSIVGVKVGSVDLITAAMAAHWFDMPRFWKEAAILLRPGGTVALWRYLDRLIHSYSTDPSTPNAAEAQRILFRLEREMLAPFETPSNRLARDMYENLPLPWDVQPQVEAFSEIDLQRLAWDCDGVLSKGNNFFCGGNEITLEELKRQLGTASMVTRWRDANPGLVGVEDCVEVTIRDLRKALGKQERLIIGSALDLLLLKRKGADQSSA